MKKTISKSDEKLNIYVDELIKSIYDDIRSTIPQEERRYNDLPPECIIWQLFNSSKFKTKFSLKILGKIIEKISPSEI